jgi:hypothetical protein
MPIFDIQTNFEFYKMLVLLDQRLPGVAIDQLERIRTCSSECVSAFT